MSLAEIGEILKFVAVPGAMLGVYFGFLKFGHKVGETHSYQARQWEAGGIAHVTLTNLKDRSTPIFGLLAVHGGVIIKLIEFDKPLVLKSFDSIQVEIPPVSEYTADGKPFDFSPISKAGIIETHIYYSTIGRWKRCVPLKRPDFEDTVKRDRRLRKRDLTPGYAFSQSVDGKVFSTDVVFVLRYIFAHDGGSAFINSKGALSWKYAPKKIDPSVLKDPQQTADLLMRENSVVKLVQLERTIGWKRRFGEDSTFKYGVDDIPIFGRRQPTVGEAEREAAGTGNGAEG